jgi:hypothetical protein
MVVCAAGSSSPPPPHAANAVASNTAHAVTIANLNLIVFLPIA